MTKSLLPPQYAPLVNPNTGLIDPNWFNYFKSEHARTGGDSSDAILDATAQATFRATVGTTSAGALATILLQVRTAVGAAWSTASIALSAMTGGTSRIELNADTIQLNGTVLSSGAINGAMVGNAALDSQHLASTAATVNQSVQVPGPITPTLGQVNTWINLATLPAITTIAGLPVDIDGQFMLHNTDAGSPGTHHYGLRLQRNGVTIWPAVAPTYGSDGGSFFNQPINWSEKPGAGSMVYTVDYFPDSISCDAVNITLRANYIKR